MKIPLHYVLGIGLVLLITALQACTVANTTPSCSPDAFSIYLTAEPMNGGSVLKADLNKVRVEAAPIIASQDIIAFEQQKNDLTLVPAARKRLIELKVPTDGRAFIICSEGKRLGAGAFWTPLSSASFDGLTILQPFSPEERSVHFSNSYPNGQSQIDDLKVLKALERAGKLR